MPIEDVKKLIEDSKKLDHVDWLQSHGETYIYFRTNEAMYSISQLKKTRLYLLECYEKEEGGSIVMPESLLIDYLKEKIL